MQLTAAELAEITQALRALECALKRQDIHFLESDLKESVLCCLMHHNRHLNKLKVCQKTIDPYKIVTWFAFDLTMRGDGTRKREILKTAVAILNSFLQHEHPSKTALDVQTLGYITELAFNESNGEADHGIGKNGLFACFHCAMKTKHALSAA